MGRTQAWKRTRRMVREKLEHIDLNANAFAHLPRWRAFLLYNFKIKGPAQRFVKRYIPKMKARLVAASKKQTHSIMRQGAQPLPSDHRHA